MPRKRIIDPEFWSDEEIGKWPFEARLFYIGLWNFADDEGRFKANPNLLKSEIFPYDIRVDIEKLKILISGKIQWYGVNGSQYGFIRNFLKHQRIDKPSESKLPIPPPFDESSENSPRTLLPNTTKDKLSKDKLSKEHPFDEVWNKYPKKLGKTDAFRWFKRQVITDVDFANINKALDNFLASDVARGDPKYIPYGSTWFNERWRDWIDIQNATGKSQAYYDLQRMADGKR